jgi:DNA-directed RNA polymerase specialized sigma subunit
MIKYEEYERLINSMVAKFYRETSLWLDKDDILGECHLAFVLAVSNYNPEKGKFSTFLVTYLKNALNNLFRSQKTYTTYYIPTPDLSIFNKSEEPFDVLSFKETINKHLKETVNKHLKD